MTTAPDRLVSTISQPSALYRAEVWRLGLWLARNLPAKLSVRLSRLLTSAYWHLAPGRRHIVMQNLLPALNGDLAAAQKTARDLFRQFGLKLVDLLRYEAGLAIDDSFAQFKGWHSFQKAQATNRGILLVTPHLGNWELGGPALQRRGVALQVLTLSEPGKNFTALRQASRARWDIETVVIGEDSFAFVEVIRRLEAEATVALLVDRPPAATSVTVELFGRPFAASVAAAELARASGCLIIPTYIVRTSVGYSADILPAIPYDRAALRTPLARRQLTQQIIQTFEPVIRRHLDQWYHFVPIWRSTTL